MKRMLGMVLVFTMLLLLCSGCGSSPEEVTPAGEADSTGEKILPESGRKNTMESAADWFLDLMPELGEPEERPREDGNGIKWVLGDDTFYVQLFPKADQPDVMELFNITIAENADEALRQKYEQICTATAAYYFEALTEANVAPLFQITPVADENYTYEADPDYYARYDPEINSFVVSYYPMGAELALYTDMQTGIRVFQAYPPVPCKNANVLELQQTVNDALSRAGYPIVLSFWEMRYQVEEMPVFSVSVSGDGVDYSEYFGLCYVSSHEEGQISDFSLWTTDGASRDTQDAVRAVFTAAAPLFCSTFEDAGFRDSFFGFLNCAEYIAQNNQTIYNDNGIYAYPYDDGLEIACETEKWILKYAESPNGIVGCTVEAAQFGKPLPTKDFLEQFFEKYPNATYSSQTQTSVKQILDVPFPQESNIRFPVTLYIRPADQAITKILVEGDYVADQEIGNYFREVVADLAVISNIGISREEAQELYDQVYFNTYSAVGYGNYQDSRLSIIRSEGSIELEITIESEALPDTENFFYRRTDGPTVTDGKFSWLDFANAYSGMVIYDYMDYYLWDQRDIPMDIELNAFVPSQTPAGEIYDHKSIHALGFYESMTKDRYGLVTVFDDNPHFVMYYNENVMQPNGLPKGYYCEGTSPEDVRQLPVCLSMMCDSDMTEQASWELFSLEMEPTCTTPNGAVTFYCPGEVAHILVTNTETGENVYYAMTKDDFEDTYGDVDGFVAAWETDAFLTSVKEAARNE